LVLDHWDIVSGDPFNSESVGGKLVEEIRLRKGLKPGIPALQNFIDQE
jgi:elongation factor 2